MRDRIAIAITIALIPISRSHAQLAEDAIRKGNTLYGAGDHGSAVEEYNKALESDPSSNTARFNLGNALYRQGRFEDGQGYFKEYAEMAGEDRAKARSFHNLGNSFLSMKKPREAVDAFKEALRLSPEDEDTRYNLAYAMELVKAQEQQEQEQQDKEQEQEGDQDDQQKDRDQQQQQEQEQDPRNEEQGRDQQNSEQRPGEQQEQRQGEPQRMSREEAERLLDAVQQQEKDVQEKLRAKHRAGVRVNVEKDW